MQDNPRVDSRAAVSDRLNGFAALEAVRRGELRTMTEHDAALIADDLLQLLPLLPTEPERGSGLVEQQRIFGRARS